MFAWVLLAVFLLVISSYCFNYRKSKKIVSDLGQKPFYDGSYGLLLVLLPNLCLLLLWLFLADFISHLFLPIVAKDPLLLIQIEQYLTGLKMDFSQEVIALAEEKRAILRSIDVVMTVVILLSAVVALIWAYWRIGMIKTRHIVERYIQWIFFTASCISVLTTIGIVFSLLFEAIRFFNIIPITDFLFGLEWQPQIAIRSDQVGSSGAFGFAPVLLGTVMISIIAIAVSLPIGLFAAIYMSQYASKNVRAVAKPLLEILAGIPTVVYGFFAVLVIAPALRNLGEQYGWSIASESALAAGLVMGIMLIPFISSLSDDVISAVPSDLKEGSYGLGATQSETIKRVILPAALPGIMSAFLLAFSRAIGETMIVVMAAGLAANLTINPLEAVTTITVQMVTLLVGDQAFDSAKTLAAFALGLTLFLVTLILNVFALKLVNKYRERYD